MEKKIRATNFYEFVRCPRRVYLSFFGDPQKKLPPSEFLQQKFQDGKDFEEKIASSLDYDQPDPGASFEKRAEQTIGFMKKGSELIYQGVLMDRNFLGIPDFLEKKQGSSVFGDYHYEVCDVKSGLSAKQEYVMQVMFYNYLLGNVQGFAPQRACLILGDSKKADIDVNKNFDAFAGILEQIISISEGKQEPVHIAGQCKECAWRDICLDMAEKKDDISLIYSIPRDKLDILKRYGIHDLKNAAKMDIEELSKINGLGEASLRKWRSQARSLLDKKDIRLENISFPDTKPIYFDIEDAETEDGKIVYLFGLVKDDDYVSFVADTPKDEEKAWLDFLDYFNDKDNFSIYVYSGHEKSMIKKLFERYGGDEAAYNKILSNLVDLLAAVRKAAVFPIYSYSIKDVAKYLGFGWTAEDAGGAQSMLWYDEWMATKNKTLLNKILLYNEEDCRAMAVVKKYLEGDDHE